MSSPDPKNEENKGEEISSVPYKGGLVCIGVLPGLGSYSDSSDENQDSSSSESEIDESKKPVVDLCGRPIVYAEAEKPCK